MIDSTSTSESSDPNLRISSESFGKLATYITREVGIKMSTAKIPMIQSRLLRRVRELGLNSIDEYCNRLFSSAEAGPEHAQLINAVTTNKTDFFREPQHFKYLTECALPQLEHEGSLRPGKRFTAWTAPCSSGEEPYTLAMVLSEYAVKRAQFDFRILATDISTKVLQIAQEGIYNQSQIDPIPRELRHKYLLNGKTDKQSLVRIVPALRRKVSFHRLNFMDSDYRVKTMFDVIFCRNVLIYFDRPTQQDVINKLCRNLHPGGYLFVSHSESLSGLSLPLLSLDSSCYRKQTNSGLRERVV